jgi:hypothetical protein
MSGTAVASASVERGRARHLGRLRGSSLGAMVMLILQYALGIGVNIYVTPGKGGFSEAFKSGPALALHAVLGLLLILAALVLVIRAIMARHGALIAASAVGLVSILVAAMSGVSFLKNAANSSSMTMALATAVAFLCYTFCLFILGSPGRRQSPGPDRDDDA